MTKTDVDIYEIIKEKGKLDTFLFDRDYTKTSLFLLPMIGFQFFTMPANFSNAFIGDQEFETTDEYSLLLLFNNDIRLSHRDKTWKQFELHSLLANPYYTYTYYAGRDGHHDLVMYVFKIPDVVRPDYDLFLEGKYSEFSDYYKSIFPKTVTHSNSETPLLYYRVIQKDKQLRNHIETMLGTYLPDDAELWAKPDLAREIFRFNLMTKK